MGCSTLVQLLLRPSHLVAAIRSRALVAQSSGALSTDDTSLAYCYAALREVSRSFAVVIARLPPALREGVCVFYLVLRALDTVEDDMSVPVPRKRELLPAFHTRLRTGGHCDDLAGVGVSNPAEADLLVNFRHVVDVFLRLPRAIQTPIQEICQQMGDGMTEFLDRKVVTADDWDLYCHYVAGLVGHGLTRLFVASGRERPCIALDLADANHMGLLLQKTNIIRDYREDADEDPPRVWWPKQEWEAVAEDVRDLRLPRLRAAAVQVMNSLVANALTHLPHCIRYLWSLTDRSVFAFCAVPQLMAVGTLAAVYDNPRVFDGKVKMAKGEAAAVMVGSDSPAEVAAHFEVFLRQLEAKLQAGSSEQIIQAIADAREAMRQPPEDLHGASDVPSATAAVLGALPCGWVLTRRLAHVKSAAQTPAARLPSVTHTHRLG
eukprot:TRINITY_DN3198_c0_g1_i1.p1 TRINITY_DN3198_c0_g1~~TRINITY_DN3198_c0_g1_i1.p1  ORF type:complete len:455 (+),score=182.34 TRINITY_DN3198_c0_g1_i1:65-1366(+)